MKRKIDAELFTWRNTQPTERRPLLLNGARQVGKTYTLRKLGEQFKNTAYFNFELNPEIHSIFQGDVTPQKLVMYLEAISGTKIIPAETLLIFDEIQCCERALTSLKYFSEAGNAYAVAAAGSLLGVAINRQQYSFPVGKVTTKRLYPLDFEEFLWALGQTELANLIREHFASLTPLPEGLHTRAIQLYREYLLVGGLPACVQKFSTDHSFLDAQEILAELDNSYTADMAKYASNTESVKIRACFSSLGAQLAKDNKKFQYKIVKKGGSASRFRAAIDWLKLSGLVLNCQKLEHAYEPIAAYQDLSAFKLYLCDVGLLCQKFNIRKQIVLEGMENSYIGALTENYVAEQLAALGYELFYWQSNNAAEVDFVLQKDTGIIGIEVKSGLNVRSKSLNVFNSKYHPKMCIRLSLRHFGQKDELQSIPLYAVFCI